MFVFNAFLYCGITYIWKLAEQGATNNLAQRLQRITVNDKNFNLITDELSQFIKLKGSKCHLFYCYVLINLLTVLTSLTQLFWLMYILSAFNFENGEIKVLHVIYSILQHNMYRNDSLHNTFPRILSCNIQLIGASGQIQNASSRCIIEGNNFNEFVHIFAMFIVTIIFCASIINVTLTYMVMWYFPYLTSDQASFKNMSKLNFDQRLCLAFLKNNIDNNVFTEILKTTSIETCV